LKRMSYYFHVSIDILLSVEKNSHWRFTEIGR
jgi:hypothetical protein